MGEPGCKVLQTLAYPQRKDNLQEPLEGNARNMDTHGERLKEKSEAQSSPGKDARPGSGFRYLAVWRRPQKLCPSKYMLGSHKKSVPLLEERKHLTFLPE